MKILNKKVIIALCIVIIVAGIYILVRPYGFVRYVSDSNFEYTESENGITLTAYRGDNESLIIPAEIDGKKVVSLSGTFYANADIKNVRISEGIEVIDYMTFWHCTGLEKVSIPDSVNQIGNAAFEGCISLKKIELGSGVKEILPYAFKSCYRLKTVKLNSGLAFIGEKAFMDCESLKKITIPATVKVVGGVMEKSLEEQLGTTERSAFDGCEEIEIEYEAGNKYYRN